MSPHRRRIACFHGGGSTGEIFKVQCRPLQVLLPDEIELVFFDGPFERGPGPGVLPYFVDYAPFKSWFTEDEHGNQLADGSGYDDERSQGRGRGGIARALEMMEAEGDDGGEWVAAMGFSQGTRVVGGLLLHQQRRGKAGSSSSIDLKFGVLCMGSGEPMLSPDPPQVVATDRGRPSTRSDANKKEGGGGGEAAASTTTSKTTEKISTPTLHLHGLKDPHLSNGRRQLATSYDAAAATLYEIDYHHAMPWNKSDAARLADLIVKMCGDTATTRSSRSGSGSR